ncbi:MAG: hypothetical protein ACK4YP_00705 [Myxococcota bacterium]
MSGGDDNDYLDGGSEGDTICGDGESGGSGDELFDGDAVDEGAGLRDILWAATSADENTLGSNSTSRDGNAICVGSCLGSTIISSRPACP